MGDEFLDNRLSIDGNEEAYKEKTRIAEVAAATLCRLNSIMKQMKGWRDDRAKLKSSIWRLKLALRVAGRETEDILHADPLIEHQRAEIKRLEAANQTLRKEIVDVRTALVEGGRVAVTDEAWGFNDSLHNFKQQFLVEKERLNNELLYLKSRLKEAEEGHEHSSEVEHLKCKLKHFMMVDHTMEIIFTDIVNKVAETIANLSEELVNVSEHLRRSRLKNDDLYLEIDKLKALLRQRCGDSADYQKRIVELDNLSKRLKTELHQFKVRLEEKPCGGSDYSDNLKNAERLANDLMSKLRNDHEALLAAGDPECLRYIKRITELRVSLKQLHVELTRSSVYLSSSYSEKTDSNKFVKEISVLEDTLEEIIVEIDRLKNDCVMRHFKVDSDEGEEYLKKIEELEVIVEKTRTMMKNLNCRTNDNVNELDIEKLENFIDTACQNIKQLGVIVAANDRSTLFQRIEELEESTIRLKVELSKKDEMINVLKQKFLEMKLLIEQKSKALQDTQRMNTALVEENKTLKSKDRQMEERMSELECELESSKQELEQLQQVRHEGNAIRKKVKADKESLLKEMGRMRDGLQKKNEEIKIIASERDTMEKALNAKIMDLGRSLQAGAREKEKLLNKIGELERAERKLLGQMKESEEARSKKEARKEQEAKKGSGGMANAESELERLRAELEASRESVKNANREIIDLKARLNHLSGDKAKLEASIFHSESKKEVLVYQLGVEKATAEEWQKELTKLTSEYNELAGERANLRNEREKLRTKLTDLKAEKELLEQSMDSVNAKYSELEAEVNEYKSERSALRKEIGNLKANAEELAARLTEARGELQGAGDTVRRLEFENSRLRDDFDTSVAKNDGFEDRLRVLLTENDELATRINELDGENVALKDQLNKVKTENECSSVELNKLRMECDKARSEGASLQAKLEDAGRGNGLLHRANEELKLKVIEAHSEYRILENQLKIAEITNMALKREKEALCCEYVSSLRSGVSKAEKEGTVFVREAILDEPADTKRSAKSDKTKKNPKDELKRLTVENEALKFELLNLRSQNFEMKTDLARTKEDLERQKIELSQDRGNETAIRPISNNLEVMNLRCKEINSYAGHYTENMGALARISQSGVYYAGSTNQEPRIDIEGLLEIMSKLRIENVALKMELNTLRCNFVVNFAEDEKRRNQLRDALEELRALKTELTGLRDERDSLRVQLDTAGTKLNHLESERAALKDELCVLRNTNSDLRRKVNELRCDYQKLKEKNAGFESCIRGAIRQIQKYTVGTGRQDNIDDELLILLKKHISNEELLQSMSEQERNFKTCVNTPTH